MAALQLCTSLPRVTPASTRLLDGSRRGRTRRRAVVHLASASALESSFTRLEVESPSRRLALCLVLLSAFVTDQPAQARPRRDRRVIPLDDYQTSGDGLKFYDVLQGKGPPADIGKTVVVHFDVIFGSINVVSSRQSKLLGGNRIIAEPYELIVGSTPGRERKPEFVENANGLYSAQASPKPPPALYSIVAGMRVGGKRIVIVPPEAGYGKRGLNEIPPDATFELDVELLEVK